jgi:hypothetical protein
MKGWRLSARRRRRATWAVGVLIAGGIIAFLGVTFSNTGHRINDPLTSAPNRPVPKVPKTVRLSQASLRDVRSVADRFVSTAVVRKRLADSWDVTAPVLRQGLTREQWLTGEIPVVPYIGEPDVVKWQLDYSFESRVGLKVALFRQTGSSLDAQVFDMELSRVGAAGSSRWLVSSWTPTAGSAKPNPPPPNTPAYTSPRPLSTIWLALPVGLILGTILIALIAMFVRGRIQRIRAERAYRRRYETAEPTWASSGQPDR